MPLTSSTKEKKNKTVVNSNMKDYSNDPFIQQKTEKAKSLIEKYGLPKSAKENQK